MNRIVKRNTKNIKSQPQTTVKTKRSYTLFLSAVICFLLAFILYFNTIKSTYVLDDNSILAENVVVTKGIHGIPTLLKTTYWYGSKSSVNTYRPFSKIMFAVEWQLSPKNPHLNHFLNVLFYALSCLLLFIVLRRYMSKMHTLIPLVITLLYAAHPIHTEVVANIKSRDEIMSFFFLMLTLLSLHTWFTKVKWWTLIISFIMFFLSLLSKEGVITMMFLFPLIGWYFTNAKPKSILISSLLLTIPAIAYILIRHQVLSNSSQPFTVTIIENFLIGAPDAASHFATAIMLLGKYLLLLTVPYQLVCDYSFNQIPIIGLNDPRFIISLLIYIAIGIYIIINFRKKSPLVFGLLFFLITISMYSNVLFQIVASFGERLMFLTSLGVCIALVFLFVKIFKVGINNTMQTNSNIVRLNPLFTAIFIIILLAFSFKTIARANEWKDEDTLFESDVKHSPNSANLCMWWGNSLFDKAVKETDSLKKVELLHKAIAQLDYGVHIYPAYIECQELLSVAWSDLGDYTNALKYAINAYNLDSNKAITSHNIGLFYFKLGDKQNALEYYKKAVKINPKYTDSYLNIGVILGENKKYEEAIEAFNNCLNCDPNNITAYNDLALCYRFLNKPDSANFWAQKAQLFEQNKGK